MTRDRFASQRGISMILVVIVVLITIILTATSLLLYARLQHLEVVQKELKANRDLLRRQQEELGIKIKNELQATGLYNSEDPKELPTQRPQEELRKRQEAANAPMAEKLAFYTDKKADLEKKEEEIAQKRRDYHIYDSLQQLVELAALRLMYVKNLNDQLKLQAQIAETHAKAVVEMKVPVTQRKISYIEHLKAQIQEVNKKIQAEDQAFTARQTELTQARDAATQGIDQERQRFYQWDLDMKNRIGDLRRQLDELRIREILKVDINTVHGRVLRPDVPNKMAFIDIGSRDRVVAGLKFLAAKPGDQGKWTYKAELIVKKVWPTYSEVAIAKVLDNDIPVIDGDVILNPLFNKRRPIVVAFAGEELVTKLKQLWTPSISEASRRIKEIGSDVRSTVTLDVDFLIFTEGKKEGTTEKQPSAYPNLVRAATLGIPYEEAAEIFKFLGD